MKKLFFFSFLVFTCAHSVIVNSQLLSPDQAKSIISHRSEELLLTLKNKQPKKFSTYIHPVKGVRISLDAFIDVNHDLKFTAQKFDQLESNKKKLVFGHADGSGDPILLTLFQYFNKSLYQHDFMNAKKIIFNQNTNMGNSINNVFKVYPKAIVVDYYFPGFDPNLNGMDWVSRRFVYEEYEGKWYLVGIIHDHWTI